MNAWVSETRTKEVCLSVEEIWNILTGGNYAERVVEVHGDRRYGWIKLERVPALGGIAISYEEQDPFRARLMQSVGYVNSLRELEKRLRELGVEP